MGNIKNVISGLMILSCYGANVSAEHDRIYTYVTEDELNEYSVDGMELTKLGFFVCSENSTWCKFV